MVQAEALIRLPRAPKMLQRQGSQNYREFRHQMLPCANLCESKAIRAIVETVRTVAAVRSIFAGQDGSERQPVRYEAVNESVTGVATIASAAANAQVTGHDSPLLLPRANAAREAKLQKVQNIAPASPAKEHSIDVTEAPKPKKAWSAVDAERPTNFQDDSARQDAKDYSKDSLIMRRDCHVVLENVESGVSSAGVVVAVAAVAVAMAAAAAAVVQRAARHFGGSDRGKSERAQVAPSCTLQRARRNGVLRLQTRAQLAATQRIASL